MRELHEEGHHSTHSHTCRFGEYGWKIRGGITKKINIFRELHHAKEGILLANPTVFSLTNPEGLQDHCKCS